MDYKAIDREALDISKNFKKCEVQLLAVIMKVDQYKVFRKMGYPSLYQYVVSRLNFSEAVAYNFIAVARKSQQVPKLKEKIDSGHLSVCKAKKITSVINQENQDHWIQLAENSTHKKVEREVALANPHQAIAERMTYISSNSESFEKVQVKSQVPKVKIELGVSEKLMLKIRRAQDLVSQKKKQATNLESTLEALVDEYIKKHDPVEKAKRQKVRGKLGLDLDAVNKSQGVPLLTKAHQLKPLKNRSNRVASKESVLENKRHAVENSHTPKGEKIHPSNVEDVEKNNFENVETEQVESDFEKTSQRVARPVYNKRQPFSAQVKHQVYLKYEGRCSAHDDQGNRCKNRRFLEIHHIQSVAKGGSNKLSNLSLLCSGHHKAIHFYHLSP